MNGAIPTELTQRERLLLMAAYFRGAKPGAEIRANCARVLRQALLWAGLWNEQLERDERRDVSNPVIEEWYSSLIAMTRVAPESGLLIEGAGNLQSPPKGPAFPSYTGCRLTNEGGALAERLLAEYPHYRP
ncbi:MAG TPA: hypothetical protein VMS17_08210 [Gemmataceae bacterium]|nr:hypothetical protein [Gemmataceae bacterium]